MAKRTARRRQRVLRQAADLMFATPQVMALRLSRMALAGPSLSRRDRREFTTMGTEKVTAFAQSWNAMTLQALRFSQALALECWTAAGAAWGAPGRQSALPRRLTDPRRLEAAALDTFGKGLAPIRRRAVGNARRLNRQARSR
jgi:hypothetical protein